MEYISEKESLENLKLFSLEHWRQKGDLVEMYGHMRGMYRVDSLSFYPREEMSKTRGLRFHVGGGMVTVEVRDIYF